MDLLLFSGVFGAIGIAIIIASFRLKGPSTVPSDVTPSVDQPAAPPKQVITNTVYLPRVSDRDIYRPDTTIWRELTAARTLNDLTKEEFAAIIKLNDYAHNLSLSAVPSYNHATSKDVITLRQCITTGRMADAVTLAKAVHLLYGVTVTSALRSLALINRSKLRMETPEDIAAHIMQQHESSPFSRTAA